jgi:5-oxoprolinase (ATP-hydrolysing) subunit C
VIEIVAVHGLATIQDAGRPGHMHEGVPPGGALAPELLARANAGVRNGTGEAAIEVLGTLTISARADMCVASEEGASRSLRAGDTWTLPRGGTRVRYLAVRGGIDVPWVLGGRGTLLVAGLGGHAGRALRKTDRLRVGASAPTDTLPPELPDESAPIRLVAGPDLDRFEQCALDVLVGSTFEVSERSDRVGTRLVGPPIARVGDDLAPSAPMVRGAIQVPASGEAIVLGPDHPTMGGYPVLATALRADVGALMARRVGAVVRFVLASR